MDECRSAVCARVRHEIELWGPDMFDISQASDGEPILYVGLEILKRHQVLEDLNVGEDVMIAYLREINRLYLCSNPYHNSIHGADVAQTVHYFLVHDGLGSHLSKLEVFALVISALVHDCAHPGFTNRYLIHTRHPIAIRYNDDSVLENFHVATAFQVGLQCEERNIFASMSDAQFTELRRLMIRLVLATDFARHNALVAECKSTLANGFEPSDDEHRMAAMILALKCADVSHTAKPMRLHVEWTMRVSLEFFFQGRVEEEKDYPRSFGMDAKTTNVPGSQVGFITGMLRPVFEFWSELFPMNKVCLEQMDKNVALWKSNRFESMSDILRTMSAGDRDENYIMQTMSAKLWKELAEQSSPP